MNKKRLLFIILLTIILVLSSCGSVENGSTVANNDSTVNDIGEEKSEVSTEVSDEETEIEESFEDKSNTENSSDESENVDESNTTTEENPYPFYPWVEQLPEGIEASVQKFDDFTLLIRYTNNTGKDIALYTEGSFFDENGDGINSYSTIQEYVKDGEDYVAVLECDDFFEYNLLYTEIDKVGARIQIANDNLSVNSYANEDGSIHIEMSTTSEDGTSVDGYVFFTDDDNNIVEYESIGWGFDGEMSDDTDIPEKEYSDYFICVSAIA